VPQRGVEILLDTVEVYSTIVRDLTSAFLEQERADPASAVFPVPATSLFAD
jgi:hypothetical protein